MLFYVKYNDIIVRELLHQGNPATITDTKLVDGYTKTFVNTNSAMHSNGVDDVLSGTTGITILVRGDKLFVANVGDSRAIIASEVNNTLKYTALSSDQTPYRKDERERIKSQVLPRNHQFVKCLLNHCYCTPGWTYNDFRSN
jgi:serine/threonine protein phosphatase PrpC